MPVTEHTLLTQIQQRFLALADIGTQSPHAQDLRDVLAALFHAQQTGNGVLSIANLNTTLPTPIEELQDSFPTLFGNTDSTAPITVFLPFIAFRRVFLQLYHVTHTLKQRQLLTPPKQSTLSQITWRFRGGGQLSEEQQLAAYAAASLPFCIITGGAGTGKTTTLTKALELILLDNPHTDILIAAPTGKAAQRLHESLHTQLDSVHDSIRASIAELAPQTLHRLLAVSERSGRAFRNEHNPLTCQVLAIDEASMISSDLLAQVLNALPANAKLILLGDANQLPPINAVAFFNDISQLAPHYTPAFAENIARDLNVQLSGEHINHDAPLANHICRLSTAKRFAEQSLIEQCANATLNQDATALINALNGQLQPIQRADALYQQLAESYPPTKDELLQVLSQRMILCANRQGEIGSQAINRYLDQHFREVLSVNNKGEWYTGRQILIEKNHSDLQLSNGDIGRCVRVDNQWLIDFGNEQFLPINMLPNDYSLAFAITIHKSQGSEYQHIDIVLDYLISENPNPLITAPLIYTAITRAKKTVAMYSDAALLSKVLLPKHHEIQLSPLVHLIKENS